MIVAGLGFRRGCDAADIVAVVRDAEQRAETAADRIAAPHFKMSEPGLLEASVLLHLPLIAVDEQSICDAQPRCITRSEAARLHTGHASIAEAAALAVAGPNATLLLPRIAHARATCALAWTA